MYYLGVRTLNLLYYIIIGQIKSAHKLKYYRYNLSWANTRCIIKLRSFY